MGHARHDDHWKSRRAHRSERRRDPILRTPRPVHKADENARWISELFAGDCQSIEPGTNAQRFGFSLREIAGFLRVRDTGGAPCRTVRAAAEQMLEAIDRQIAELGARREEMRKTLRGWDRRLKQTPAGTPGRLLENL